MDLDRSLAASLPPGEAESGDRPSADPSESADGWDETASDARLVAALEEYEAACRGGARPDRSSFLRAHAGIAAELAECLEGLDCLQGAGAYFRGDLAATGLHGATAVHPDLPDRLGDYQIIRELGRGGMGVVYEAEQVSLGRRVALKLLPFTAAMDPRQVQRFQVEVQAAAHLNHPHIVPIYAVGREAGTHYYAMQYVPGRSLAAVIADVNHARKSRRDPISSWNWSDDGSVDPPAARSSRDDSKRGSPYFRGVARLISQAAEALDHAHSLGVVHRDVKPANLLLDDRGEIWVADFGLARLQGDSGLTVTGDLAGTLRYMSPEQALARREVVDHRTDVYSLGVTLYELLTLKPAFPGNDMPMLVHQITNEDPAPPSKHEPLLPRDLETIVLKAMAKEPGNRCATAHEMAEDLDRFLDDRPILARRPSLLERAWRWTRRHRAIAASVAALLVLATFCLSISTLVVWNAKWRIQDESDARGVELRRAQDNLHMAHRALELYLKSAEEWFPRETGADRRAHDLIRTALDFYEQIATRNDSDPRSSTGRSPPTAGSATSG